MSARRVVATGLGAVSAAGVGVERLRAAVSAGRRVTEVPDFAETVAQLPTEVRRVEVGA